MTSVVKTNKADPRVPGIRDEIPFPLAKQCSPKLDSPSCQFKSPFRQKLQRLQEKPISQCGLRSPNHPELTMVHLRVCFAFLSQTAKKLY